MLDRNVNIITDLDGKKFVLINDIRFKAKRREDWENVETYLKEYVEEFYEIAEVSTKSTNEDFGYQMIFPSQDMMDSLLPASLSPG